MIKRTITLLAFAVALSACAENPAANKTKAEVTAPSSNTASNTAAPSAPRTPKGEAIALSPENSKIDFTGSKVTGKHDGNFKSFTGAIDLVNNKPEESQVSLDIQMNSVTTDADGLTKHLQNADFFDVEKFPKSTFVSTKITPDTGKGADMYNITGDLEMRGVKKTISFPAKITVTPAEVGVDSEFFINRKDFGIAYAGKADDLIRDEVVLKLNVRAPRKK
jgi:polyisoprenoid-binding protein YceI